MSPTFDYAAPFVPANTHYVGPILDEPAWAEPFTLPWPDDDLPFVLVGLSSTFQDQAALGQRIIDALSGLPVRAVVTTGPALDSARFSAAGVPLVCIPMGRDQDDTAARVVHHGAEVRLSAKASADQIRAAIGKVLVHREYLHAAERLADAIAAERETSTLVADLEGLPTIRATGGDGPRR